MDIGRKSLGICIGASSIKVVELIDAEDGLHIGRTEVVRHDCNTRGALLELLEQFPPAAYEHVCVTGRKFKDLVNLPTITEPEAVEYALRGVGQVANLPERRWGGSCTATPTNDSLRRAPDVSPGMDELSTEHHPRADARGSPRQVGKVPHALMSLGSESFILYQLDEAGAIVGVRAGNKCASGTGEFFLQQIRRMDLGIEEASRLSAAVEPYAVSGRCSVFCKSDCTHALNKGLPKERVCAGLGNMIADKALEILGSLPRENVLIVGGVTRNDYVVSRLREKIANLVVPPYAEVFEALGAAVYAMERRTTHSGPLLLAAAGTSFSTLPPLRDAAHWVTFQEHARGQAADGDETVLGLDVGSTTTKAVLMRTADDKILAAVYLRTNGNPIKAARECYAEICRQLQDIRVSIMALGVTGSGRHIAALHAGTDGIVNEIIAHATAAAFFDREVDTILEIGGQDAKYTYLVNGVPCDYAMNEACSAGTGSFLEEAAKESLGIDVLDIQEIALRADAPPNFNDQCAAFISSDIKNASYEIGREDIVAGLVYSICMNYNNRVKGPRKVGRKVFMQGGVCYNRAVPLAMAALLQRPIVVPPEPGLMGAFGVALEVKQRLSLGLLERGQFDFDALVHREVSYGKTFTCAGTKENCDRGCQINVIKLEGRSLPFGGICNKYYNLAHKVEIDPRPFDFVAARQEALYRGAGCQPASVAAGWQPAPRPAAVQAGWQPAPRTIGLTRSFLTNLLYPLYEHFFRAIGLEVVLSDAVDAEGMRRVGASFCYPAELAHGLMMNLVRKNLDYIFLPQVAELHVEQGGDRAPGHQSTCIALQAEPFFLRSAFKDVQSRILTPVLNWSAGWDSMEDAFVRLGRELGCDRRRASAAYREAVAAQRKFFRHRKELGRAALMELERDPNRVGVVLFGRPYNTFAAEANMGIPRKFASRGVACIPFDCLPFHDRESLPGMTWAMGHDLVRAARFVKEHPQLFGAFVTNFSCGPDSFVVGYFRDIMQTKPSLTLEIDSHTADAGVNTRVEAFLDIVDRFRKLRLADPPQQPFRRATVVIDQGEGTFIASDGRHYSLRDPRVKLVMPSMGRTLSEAACAALRGLGMRAESVPLPDFQTLMQGRANTSCKECLPLILTTGSLLEYLERRREPGELLLYFMPTTNGNCRFSQYNVFLKRLIEKKRIENVAVFSLTTANGYGGMGAAATTKILKGLIVSDVMDDVRSALGALAVDRDEATAAFQQQWDAILDCLEHRCKGFYPLLRETAITLGSIRLKQPLAEAKRVLMAGEIFVRKDEFSSQRVVDALARRGIVAQRAPMMEWFRFVDYRVQHIDPRGRSPAARFRLAVRTFVLGQIERKIKRTLARSGLCQPDVIDIESIMNVGQHFVSKTFGGETILAVGRFFKDILRDFHGMISIGPFACLPTRVIESILTPESKIKDNRRLDDLPDCQRLQSLVSLPFLSIECDGNPFPQIIEAQLEAFCLQVERLHGKGGEPQQQAAGMPQQRAARIL